MHRRHWLGLGAQVALSMFVNARAAPSESLRVGLTAVILADQAAFLTRWSDYLSARMGQRVVFVARESYQDILDLLFSEQLDAAWICGYPYVLHQHRLRLLASPLYQGKPLYQAYLIGRPDLAGSAWNWGALKGRVLAYADPLSNSGWLVAQAQMRAAGLTARDLRRSFFAHSHRNVAEAVASGLAQVGCIDGYVWETMRLQHMALIDSTRVLWRSDWFAFPPLVARVGDNNPALKALATTLQHMVDDSQGASLLQALNLSGFAPARVADFEPIRQLARQIGRVEL
ncbi:MAG: phosphonate ABC transporter substrate-binding protein [Comamonadaceae bacterium CG1_02_60_18]|nr:MAG: phosphonate ABC transporter substrate-binding protein [Comamonadaceae bacterium CG1_02_60_18]